MSEKRDSVLCVRVSQQELEALREVAKIHHLSISELVRMAISYFIKNNANIGGDSEESIEPAGESVKYNPDDMTTVNIADKLLLKLALYDRDVITFDKIRAFLKTIKPAIYPHQEQNVVYLLQGLGILQAVGASRLITDPSRHVGVFKINLPDDVLCHGIIWRLAPGNGHERKQPDKLILQSDTHIGHG